ncbi:hypothetical protein ZIOFF_007171 [Zingiber officinale]|uniref:Interactor of constitutive active ROPs 1 n=1 Tax=Zingiber officinale TaxID=94328 RepID=A0A8J5I0Q6_ZINOF|nr:hypothetical protein ZIOFF_007171 [Zingiber officinale]
METKRQSEQKGRIRAIMKIEKEKHLTALRPREHEHEEEVEEARPMSRRRDRRGAEGFGRGGAEEGFGVVGFVRGGYLGGDKRLGKKEDPLKAGVAATPESRGSSDAPQRQSPRAPLHLRSTACSEANNAHRRVAAADGSPKVSPRGGSQEQRKRSTRAAELETKLRETQAELKKLREQLAVAEAAKREVERALVKVKVRVPAAALAKKRKEEEVALSQGSRPEGVRQNETMEESVTSLATMDVFEVLVPAESVPTEDEADSKQEITMVDKTETNENDETISAAGEEEEEGEKKEDGKKREDEEVGFWKAKLLEKEKEVAILLEENVIFKTRAEEEAQRIAESSRSKQEEFTARLNSVEEQLKESKTNEKQLAAQLETAEGAKATLEMELKRLKVQTEQWRKAAEAAASALATGDAASGDETGGRRVAERCRSMDKQHLGVGYDSWASPLADQDYVYEEDGAGGSRGGRRKAAGVRMFGNLWKKNQYK